MDWLNSIVQGVLVGGLYALFAAGLSLIFGVMRLVNIAHGDLIVLAAYLALVATQTLGIGPLASLLVIVPLMALLGYALQRLLLNRSNNVLAIVLVTFGLSVIIQYSLQGVYGADTRLLSGGGIQTATIIVGGGINIGVLPLTIFIAAVALVSVLDLLLYRSRLGARIRAVSDDTASANLIGLPSARIYAVAMGIVGVTIAICAAFMSVWTNFDPTSGPNRLLIAFEAVVLGGLGSLWGTLAGGIIVGVAQSVGAHFDAGWQLLAGHLVFLVVFLIRPQGLFPK